MGSAGSTGKVRRIKISSAAKFYIKGIGAIYELCAPSPPSRQNPLNRSTYIPSKGLLTGINS